jgi:hypothetical protein
MCAYVPRKTAIGCVRPGRLWGYGDATGASCVFKGQSLSEVHVLLAVAFFNSAARLAALLVWLYLRFTFSMCRCSCWQGTRRHE